MCVEFILLISPLIPFFISIKSHTDSFFRVYTTISSKIFQNILKDIIFLNANEPFQSLTLTQLAELHDKICLLTSNMVQQDPVAYDRSTINWNYDGDPLRADYDALNRRIAALQKQIAEKQIEAGWKLQELRRALRLEQANLIQISDRMNLERRRNLALHLTMDDSA